MWYDDQRTEIGLFIPLLLVDHEKSHWKYKTKHTAFRSQTIILHQILMSLLHTQTNKIPPTCECIKVIEYNTGHSGNDPHDTKHTKRKL